MAKKDAEGLLIAGGENKVIRGEYDAMSNMEEFIALSAKNGYNFSEEELMAVLNEAGDSFERNGNPPKYSFWWT